MPLLLLQHHSHQQLFVTSHRVGTAEPPVSGAWLKAHFGLGCSSRMLLVISKEWRHISTNNGLCQPGDLPAVSSNPSLRGAFEVVQGAWLWFVLRLWLLGAAVELLLQIITGVRTCKKLPGLCSVGSFFFSPLPVENEGWAQRGGFAVGSDHCSSTEAKQAELIYTVSRGAPSWRHFKAVTFKMNQCHCDGIALHQLRSTTASPGSQVLIKLFPLNCMLSGEQVFSNKKPVSHQVLVPGAIDNN